MLCNRNLAQAACERQYPLHSSDLPHMFEVPSTQNRAGHTLPLRKVAADQTAQRMLAERNVVRYIES